MQGKTNFGKKPLIAGRECERDRERETETERQRERSETFQGHIRDIVGHIRAILGTY